MSKSAKLLFIAVYILVALGIIMTYSASAMYATHLYNFPQHFLYRQIIYAVMGTVAMFIMMSIPQVMWREYSRPLMIFGIAILFLVYIPGLGHTAGGARRWIKLAFFNVQPIELTKLIVCIYLSDYLARKVKTVRQGGLMVFVPPLVLIMMVCGLSLSQPDLGSCAVILAISALLFFVAGLKLKYVLVSLTGLLPVFYFLVIRVPYRLSRVTAYLNPWDDPKGSGFQMIQSFLAYGVGGWKGVGLGQSTQKLFYLPSGHNDFIFAVIGEELGLLGNLAIVILFAIIFFCGMNMAVCSTEIFEKFLAFAITMLLVLQAVINMFVATGLFPTKGLPLPFVSYGGTSLVTQLMAVGLLLGLDSRRRVLHA